MSAHHSIGTTWAGRYRLDERLDQAGMAAVYRATDARVGATVAVKILDSDAASAIGEKRFAREIEIASMLDHPRVVPVIDSGLEHGSLFYVMPFLEGESLRSLMDRTGPLPLARVRSLTADIAEALTYAHSRGVIHRDIKPQNVMVTEGGAVVLDFGIARAASADRDDRLTHSGVSVGTPAYMSPEQAAGAKRIDARSDQYSLACVVHEMLVGEPPFSGPNERAVIARHLAAEPPRVSVVRPDVPEVVSEALRIALSKAPAARHASVERFAAEIQRQVERSWSWRRSRGPLAAGALGAAAIGFLLVVQSRPRTTLDANKIVGFPLADLGQPGEAAITGTDVALWLGVALQHAYPLKWYDAWDLLDRDQRDDAKNLTAAHARTIATRLGAARFLMGVVQHGPDSTRVVLRLWDTDGDSLVQQESAASHAGAFGSRPALNALIRLLPRIVDPGRTIDLAPLLDRDPAAVASWIQGEREYRSAEFAAALNSYRQALERDSLVALAALKGALAASWLERRDQDDAHRLVRTALRLVEWLPEPQRAMAAGVDAYLRGDAERADSELLTAVELDPEWPEAWMARGEATYHLVTPGGDSVAELSFTRASELDPDFVPPLIHLAAMRLRAGALERAEDVLDRIAIASSQSTLPRQLELVQRCVRGSPDEVDWPAEVESDIDAVREASREFAVAGAFPDCAERAARAIVDSPDSPPGDRWGAVKTLHNVLVARGRFAEALEIADAAYQSGTLRAGLLYLADAALGVPVEGRDTVFAHTLIDILETQYGPDYLSAAQPTTSWALAAWHASRNELGALRAIRAGVEGRARSDDDPLVATALSAVRGWTALVEGDTSAAIAFFSSGPRGRPRDLAWDPTIPMAAELHALAAVLSDRGEHERALETASIFDHPQPVAYLAYLHESLAVRARSAQALGRTADAEEYRARLERLRPTVP